jgi:CheY-like chemotaxis protein
VEQGSENASSRLALIVDDVADNRDLYAAALQLAGFRVMTAERAEEGLELAFTTPPDIIVMDHSLPGLDGCEATRLLKKDPRTKNVPVIMVTGHALTSIEELARECGADDFRTKPLTPTDLMDAIVVLIERFRQQTA